MTSPSHKTLRRGAWLAAALAPVAIFDYSRTGIVDATWLYTICGLLGSVGIVVGTKVNRCPRPLGWYLIAAGNLSFVLGDLIYFFIDARWGVTFPGIPDIPYLAGYPLMAWGLGLLVRERTRGQGSVIDASIIATSAALIGWVFLMEPYASDPSLTIGAKLVSIAYPMGDLVLIAVICGLLFSGVHGNPSLRWLMVSMAGLLISDIVYAITILQDTYQGGWVDAGYLVGYLTLASAGLHPSMRRLTPPEPKIGPALSRRRLLLMAAAAITGPGLLGLAASRGADVDVGVIVGGSIVLFLFAILRMAGLMRAVEHNASQLSEQKSQLSHTLEELRLVEGDRRRLLDAVLKTSELERSSLAADLHDGPIQALTALGLEVELAVMDYESVDMQTAERLREIQNGFAEQIGSLRTLMANLRPPVLEERGLAAALQDMVAAFRVRTGIVCETNLVPVQLDRTIETVLYRVAQEAVTNIGKHAAGSKACVTLQLEGDEVVLEISDDGVGFDVHHQDVTPEGGHLGLVSMRERVELAGGAWNLNSTPGGGTQIRVCFDKIGARDARKSDSALA